MLGLDQYEGIHMIDVTKKGMDEEKTYNINESKIIQFWHA